MVRDARLRPYPGLLQSASSPVQPQRIGTDGRLSRAKIHSNWWQVEARIPRCVRQWQIVIWKGEGKARKVGSWHHIEIYAGEKVNTADREF